MICISASKQPPEGGCLKKQASKFMKSEMPFPELLKCSTGGCATSEQLGAGCCCLQTVLLRHFGS